MRRRRAYLAPLLNLTEPSPAAPRLPLPQGEDRGEGAAKTCEQTWSKRLAFSLRFLESRAREEKPLQWRISSFA
jgi:hypothetical protein